MNFDEKSDNRNTKSGCNKLLAMEIEELEDSFSELSNKLIKDGTLPEADSFSDEDVENMLKFNSEMRYKELLKEESDFIMQENKQINTKKTESSNIEEFKVPPKAESQTEIRAPIPIKIGEKPQNYEKKESDKLLSQIPAKDEYTESRYDDHNVESSDMGNTRQTKTYQRRPKKEIFNRDFKCKLCHKEYVSKSSLYTHIKKKHETTGLNEYINMHTPEHEIKVGDPKKILSESDFLSEENTHTQNDDTKEKYLDDSNFLNDNDTEIINMLSKKRSFQLNDSHKDLRRVSNSEKSSVMNIGSQKKDQFVIGDIRSNIISMKDEASINVPTGKLPHFVEYDLKKGFYSQHFKSIICMSRAAELTFLAEKRPNFGMFMNQSSMGRKSVVGTQMTSTSEISEVKIPWKNTHRPSSSNMSLGRAIPQKEIINFQDKQYDPSFFQSRMNSQANMGTVIKDNESKNSSIKYAFLSEKHEKPEGSVKEKEIEKKREIKTPSEKFITKQEENSSISKTFTSRDSIQQGLSLNENRNETNLSYKNNSIYKTSQHRNSLDKPRPDTYSNEMSVIYKKIMDKAQNRDQTNSNILEIKNQILGNNSICPIKKTSGASLVHGTNNSVNMLDKMRPIPIKPKNEEEPVLDNKIIEQNVRTKRLLNNIFKIRKQDIKDKNMNESETDDKGMEDSIIKERNEDEETNDAQNSSKSKENKLAGLIKNFKDSLYTEEVRNFSDKLISLLVKRYPNIDLEKTDNLLNRIFGFYRDFIKLLPGKRSTQKKREIIKSINLSHMSEIEENSVLKIMSYFLCNLSFENVRGEHMTFCIKFAITLYFYLKMTKDLNEKMTIRFENIPQLFNTFIYEFIKTNELFEYESSKKMIIWVDTLYLFYELIYSLNLTSVILNYKSYILMQENIKKNDVLVNSNLSKAHSQEILGKSYSEEIRNYN